MCTVPAHQLQLPALLALLAAALELEQLALLAAALRPLLVLLVAKLLLPHHQVVRQ
jgi:hypothetical protein